MDKRMMLIVIAIYVAIFVAGMVFGAFVMKAQKFSIPTVQIEQTQEK
jgi:flagellar basal body-associated protein FliL